MGSQIHAKGSLTLGLSAEVSSFVDEDVGYTDINLTRMYVTWRPALTSWCLFFLNDTFNTAHAPSFHVGNIVISPQTCSRLSPESEHHITDEAHEDLFQHPKLIETR
jgi:hypothetical protein